jgi:hypothetical protein
MSTSRLFYITDKNKGKDYWNGEAFHGVMVNKGRVDVTCVGIGCVDSSLDDVYDTVDDMPVWVQERIAMLMVCEDGQTIDHIGRRVDDSTFWLFGGA